MSSEDSSALNVKSMESRYLSDKEDEGHQPSIPTQKLSCEHCRGRKVRCDRIHPCTPCVRKGILCEFPRGFKSRQKKQRTLDSTTCKNKIEEISGKLDQIRSVIDTIRLPPNPVDKTSLDSQLSPYPHLSWNLTPQSQPRGLSSLPSTTQGNVCDADSEGEASLKTHAAYAADLVEQMVGSTYTGVKSDIMSSLDALRNIVQTNKQRESKRGNSLPCNPVEPSLLGGLEMPPLETAMTCLNMLKERETILYVCLFEIESLGEFVEYLLCCYLKRPSHAHLMIANAGLARAFNECVCYDMEPGIRIEYERRAGNCRQNLEILVSQLPFSASHNFDLALALSMASTEYMTLSRPRMAWKLAVHSAHICHSLGYNRNDTLGVESSIATRRQRRLFLGIFVTEKSLAFRLGKASTIRSSDVPLVDAGILEGYNVYLKPFWHKWVAISLLQDEVYDSLCSPRALIQSAAEREVKARTLAAQMENLLFNQDAAEIHCMEEIRATAGETISEIFTRAERITGLAILTLIYRTIEPDIATGTVLSSQCISTALRALSEHQECMRLLEHTEHNMMDFYVQWALLSAPFVPYIVIFCLAIETSSSLHLTKLASVVHATEKVACNYNDAYGKQLAIFKLMYDVACKWIKAKNASSGTRGTESYSTQILSPLKQPAGTGVSSSYQFPETRGLESLGSAVRNVGGEQKAAMPGVQGYQLGDWMDQNYQIFQLLDDDAFFGY